MRESDKLQITHLKGIGIKRAAVLRSNGISTAEDLSKMTLSSLQEILPEATQDWIDNALEKSGQSNIIVILEKESDVVVSTPTSNAKATKCPKCGSFSILPRAEAAYPRVHLRCQDCRFPFAIHKETGDYLL